jgi:hypothetical protein
MDHSESGRSGITICCAIDLGYMPCLSVVIYDPHGIARSYRAVVFGNGNSYDTLGIKQNTSREIWVSDSSTVGENGQQQLQSQQ